MLNKTTPYYHNHINNGAEMLEKGGWIRPAVFSSVEEEVECVRNKVGIIDAHSMGKATIVGKDARKFMQYIMTNDLNRINIGQGIYSCLCNEKGGIVDDIIAYYISDEEFYIITNTLSKDRVIKWLNKVSKDFSVYVFDTTNTIGYLSVQGPRSRDLIEKIFNKKVTLKYFEFSNEKLFDADVLLARTGYTGELGYEFNFPSEYGVKMWEYIEEQGKEYGIKPVGGQAIQVLRSEKAYRSHGTDMTVETNPFEVGLAWTVRLNKEEEFIGKSALTSLKEQGTKNLFRGFEVSGGKLPKKGQHILVKNKKAGVITTSFYSTTLKKNLAMGYIESEHINGEEQFTVEFPEDNTSNDLTISDIPFYDKEGIRTKS